MPQKSRNHELCRAALCAVFGIAVVIAGSAAVRAGENGEDEGPYKKFFNKMLSNVGLRDQDAAIDYKERPPLVVPPSRDLPPPVAAGSLAVKNPAWPSDPDQKKRAVERRPKIERSVLAGDKLDNPAAQTSQGDGTQQSKGVWSSRVNFGKSITGNNVETGTFVQEPSRTSLTDPPAGYRTPSPTQPYGINGMADRAKGKSGTDRQAETVSR